MWSPLGTRPDPPAGRPSREGLRGLPRVLPLAVAGVVVLALADRDQLVHRPEIVDEELAVEVVELVLECSPDDLEFEGGAYKVRGTGASRTIQELAYAAFLEHDLPEGVEARLDSDATFDPDNYSFPHGTHLCAMEVDTETGQLKMRKYVACDDIGTSSTH